MRLLLILLFSYQMLFAQKLTTVETHSINIESLQYYSQKSKDHILTYSPLHRVKLTIKAVLNSNILSKVNTDTLMMGYVRDGLVDIETRDMMTLIKYETRLKIYLAKRWRLLLRAQLVGYHNNLYTVGFIRKF